MFGDLGTDNPKALPRLRRDTQQGMYDAVLHVGEALARVCLEEWVLGGRRHQDCGGDWGRSSGGSEGTRDETGCGDGGSVTAHVKIP